MALIEGDCLSKFYLVTKKEFALLISGYLRVNLFIFLGILGGFSVKV